MIPRKRSQHSHLSLLFWMQTEWGHLILYFRKQNVLGRLFCQVLGTLVLIFFKISLNSYTISRKHLFSNLAILNRDHMVLGALAHLKEATDWKQFFTHHLIQFIMQLIQF